MYLNIIQEDDDVISKVTQILSRDCFNFRGSESNVECKNVSKSTETFNILWLLLNLVKDKIKCNIICDYLKADEKLTRRCILSAIQKIFYPIFFYPQRQ